MGSKRHILTDREGLPIAVKITGANAHDKWLAESVLSLAIQYAQLCASKIVHLCLDKGYDYKDTEIAIRHRNVIPHIRRRGEAPLGNSFKGKARRWVVERTNSWHNQYRSLLVRHERRSENYLAFVQFACVFIIFNKLARSGRHIAFKLFNAITDSSFCIAYIAYYLDIALPYSQQSWRFRRSF